MVSHASGPQKRWAFEQVNEWAVRDRIVRVANGTTFLNFLCRDYPGVYIIPSGLPRRQARILQAISVPAGAHFPLHTFLHPSPNPWPPYALLSGPSRLTPQDGFALTVPLLAVQADLCPYSILCAAPTQTPYTPAATSAPARSQCCSHRGANIAS
jgi:hypothetical protein